MQCKFCGYEWTTLSQLQNVVCPSCLLKNTRLSAPSTSKEGKESGNAGGDPRKFKEIE